MFEVIFSSPYATFPALSKTELTLRCRRHHHHPLKARLPPPAPQSPPDLLLLCIASRPVIALARNLIVSREAFLLFSTARHDDEQIFDPMRGWGRCRNLVICICGTTAVHRIVVVQPFLPPSFFDCCVPARSTACVCDRPPR